MVRVAGVFRFDPLDDRDALRGDLAADVFVVFPRLEVPLDVLPRAELELRAFPFDLSRAVVVRDEADFEAPRDEDPALLAPLRDEPPLRLLREAVFGPPLRAVELLPRLAVLLLRPDELLLRPPLELFFDEEPPRDDLLPDEDLLPEDDLPPDDERLPLDVLRDEDEPPFFPAALFLEDVLFEPPPEDRDELELFFEPPLLLLEPEDERELDDFLVVAMLFTLQYFVWYLPAPPTVSNICADLKMYGFITVRL